MTNIFFSGKPSYLRSLPLHYSPPQKHQDPGLRGAQGRTSDRNARAGTEEKTENRAARSPPTYPSWGTQAATHAGRRCARHPEKTPPRRIRKRASPECVLCYLDPGMQSASSLSQSDRTHERAGASRPSTCTHHSHTGHTVRYCHAHGW